MGRRAGAIGLVMVVIGAFALPVAAIAQASSAGDSYRTVVVFGDTQDLVDGKDLSLYPGFETMMDWVLSNREDQNIDFVLHVGDIIEHGHVLPLSTTCLNAVGRCDSNLTFGSKEKPRPCNCRLTSLVDGEWQRFNAVWSRLDGKIPYAIVQGNHDNMGIIDASRELDRDGFSQYFSEAYFRDIVGSGLIASHAEASILSHAWKFTLGQREVLVLGVGDEPTPDTLAWAQHRIDEEPDLPVIVLSHRFFEGVPHDERRPRRIWSETISKNIARIELAIWGHISVGEIVPVSLAGGKLLRIRTNWQGQPGLQTFMHLLRFHQRDGKIHALEVVAFDPVRQQHDSTPALRRRTWSGPIPFSLDR
jgi:hypothetical protein